MSVFTIKTPSSRIISSESVAAGSTAGASTVVFGTATNQVRVAASQVTWLLIDTAPSVVSTTILTTGTMMPANTIDYFTVTPGQRLSAVTSVAAATAQLTVTQVA